MRLALLAVICLTTAICHAQNLTDPLQPFGTDEHTRLLYHFDEGEGTVAQDASQYGNAGELRGPKWVKGRYGKALWFDGKHDCVYREVPKSIMNIKQITLECWMNQDDTWSRRFMAGQDVGFHFEADDNTMTSMSLYNQGGSVPNAEGKPHQQCYANVGLFRPGRWHHIAITYDGEIVSHFVDGVLKARYAGPKDFSLGVPSRGFWVGCYVGTDYWFSGMIDEFRVSDCVRYDPEKKLAIGEKIFEMATTANKQLCRPREVRKPVRTGEAKLQVTLRKRFGGNATGWVFLKPPGKPAAIVGQYALTDATDGSELAVDCDVSDELTGDGTYILGLEPADTAGYIAMTSAELSRGATTVGKWLGEALSRRTFHPSMLVPLQVGAAPDSKPRDLLLLPSALDRAWGTLELDESVEGQPPLMVGDGNAEWWVNSPTKQAYRVHMRFTGAGRPCDIVIDGNDLNDFDMCGTTGMGRSQPADSFFDYQGSVTLQPGVHWIRLQDILPDIVALWLEPVDEAPTGKVPWARYAVPEPGFLTDPAAWSVQASLGKPTDTSSRLDTAGDKPTLRFAAGFANTDPANLFAGDRARFVRRGEWDLEPFGQLKFGFQGQGTDHVASLWLVDAKGDQKLLWRMRDQDTAPQDITLPLSFEGNDVFDPGHVVAICVDLDEGNTRPTELNHQECALIAPTFERRDVLAAAVGQVTRPDPAVAPPAVLQAPAFRPWLKPIVPETHPLYATTDPKPVTRATMGYDLHFTGARAVDTHALDSFHKFYDFGDICWPHMGILPQRRDFADDAAYANALKEMEKRLQDVHDRNLILWDIWGYVPFGEAGPTPQVKPEHHEALMRILGDRFLGYDDGEQDGRYIGAYADRGSFTDRKGGWDDFVKWDTGICNDSMNYMNATGSLNFSHYYAERGCRTLGLETAQGLPSDTLMFAFLRGASKQYGRLTTQATSIWSRFGYNIYGERKTDGANGYGFGPHKGCSLSLHGRLFFQSYTGGDSIVGSETSQFTSDVLGNTSLEELSPLGKQHLAIHDWAKQHPDRGVMVTPVAFMLAFYNGWNIPRHLYRGDKYKIWGKLPYEKGDYLTDAMFRMVWPGYEDTSYLRNERGFITPTPYGDIFDVITNRCHADILKQYQAIVLLGDVELTPDVVAKLQAYVAAGGDLVLSAKLAAAFPEAFTGAKFGDQATASLSRDPASGTTWQELPYTYTVLTLAGAKPLLVNEAGNPLVTLNQSGKGRVIVGAADYWMTDKLTYAAPDLVNMEPPYALLKGVQTVLAGYFGSFAPATAQPGGLNVRVNGYDADPKRWLIALTNNELFADWQGEVILKLGEVAQATELWRGEPVQVAGNSLKLSIPAGEVAMVEVRLK